MEDTIPDKAYFRIGEVSSILGVEPYVVRYWESEFKSVRPVRTSSDQRLYRRKDLEQLLLIRDLLYRENFTIRGAKKQLSRLGRDHSPEETPVADAEGYRRLLGQIKISLEQIRNILA